MPQFAENIFQTRSSINLYVDLYIQVWYYETIKKEYKLNVIIICTIGVFLALAFVVDFPPVHEQNKEEAS